MSAKKSWDVLPKARPAASAAPVREPARRPQRVRTSVRKSPSRRVVARRAQGIALGLLLAILGIGGIYAAWMPSVRIQNIEPSGPHAEAVAQTARETLMGTYLYLAPHDSIAFFSPHKMRKAILEQFPDISAVSIRHTSLTSIAITATPRASAFIWCGTSIDSPRADGKCFDTDSSGLVFAEAEMHGSSTLRVFGPLEGGESEENPIRAHVVNADAIPMALRFVKAVRELGAPVSAVALRTDEADLWLSGPTRLTYLLGKEERALQLATSALPALNLKDHSIQYVDLRFEGKVYVKRYGQ